MFDLADASNRLARWRLRLLEFDFEVRYRKGCENTVADAISRLPTFGHTHIAPDLDIPCLAVECDHERRRVLHHVDTESWNRIDWDPDACESDDLLAKAHRRLQMALEEGVVFEVQEVKAITIDEIRDAQENRSILS